LKQKKRQVRFQVVSNNFPISHDGILGKEFLENNKIAIDYAKNEITSTTTEDNSTLVNQDIIQVDNFDIIEVPPRLEMIISIQITDNQIKESDTLIIYSQGLQNLVQCGNVITTVKDRQALTKIVNQNEKSVKLRTVNLNNLVYEQCEETSVRVCTKFPEMQENGHRLQLLEKSL